MPFFSAGFHGSSVPGWSDEGKAHHESRPGADSQHMKLSGNDPLDFLGIRAHTAPPAMAAPGAPGEGLVGFVGLALVNPSYQHT